jgi:hypothetical protein
MDPQPAVMHQNSTNSLKRETVPRVIIPVRYCGLDLSVIKIVARIIAELDLLQGNCPTAMIMTRSRTGRAAHRTGRGAAAVVHSSSYHDDSLTQIESRGFEHVLLQELGGTRPRTCGPSDSRAPKWRVNMLDFHRGMQHAGILVQALSFMNP